jgi:hypothetical protein
LTRVRQRRIESREHAQSGHLRDGAEHLAVHLLGRSACAGASPS